MADPNPLHDNPRSRKYGDYSDADAEGIDERYASGNRESDHIHKYYSGGKKYDHDLSDEEKSAPFKKKEDKKRDGYEFENVDPRKEWAGTPADALQKYRKDHFDSGGTYDHWDKDDKDEAGKPSYWRLKKQEKPTS